MTETGAETAERVTETQRFKLRDFDPKLALQILEGWRDTSPPNRENVPPTYELTGSLTNGTKMEIRISTGGGTVDIMRFQGDNPKTNVTTLKDVKFVEFGNSVRFINHDGVYSVGPGGETLKSRRGKISHFVRFSDIL